MCKPVKCPQCCGTFAPALSYGLREAKAVSAAAYGVNISAIAAPILITIRSKSYERQYFTRY